MRHPLPVLALAAIICPSVGSGPTLALASQGPPAPSCDVVGLVMTQETRKEPGRGLSEGTTFTYTDITLRIVNQAYTSEGDEALAGNVGAALACDHEPGSEVTFQLRDNNQSIMDWLLGKTHEGLCVKGTSQYFGDGNFQSGNWLTITESLDGAACDTASTPQP